MLQSVNIPLCQSVLGEYGTWEELRREVEMLGLDGVEGIWGGEPVPQGLPAELIIGYHLTFYSDWLDLYRGDLPALVGKFGSLDTARSFYGGLGADTLLEYYRADLVRAKELGVRYVVFHVTDVSIEETYTYRWCHSSEEVVDAAVEVINTLLGEEEPPFEFLVENQWWPGFTFTQPELTAQLLAGIRCSRKGIMLDIGHLMNANTALRTQAEGAAFLMDMLNRNGELSRMIRGVHLHYSLSGDYVKAHTGALPLDLPGDYNERFSTNYSHILQIDRHLPWTDPAILPILKRIHPAYLTHELYAPNRGRRRSAVQTQRTLLERGGLTLD